MTIVSSEIAIAMKCFVIETDIPKEI